MSSHDADGAAVLLLCDNDLCIACAVVEDRDEDSCIGFSTMSDDYSSPKVKFAALATEETYGSTSSSPTSEESADEFDGQRSFHLGMKRVNVSNIWTSQRLTDSFAEFGDEYELVPTELVDNVKLVADPNLDPKEKGTLYYAEDAFYNKHEKPQYALTVNTDIYRRILEEVSDARSIPCGLYFCCHGGDGAHTGVSHDDYVDIRMAWFLVILIFAIMLFLSAFVPWPINDNDDFFE